MSYDDDGIEEFPIAYSIDNAILMHRDAHFSGDFKAMLDYYRLQGRGISNDFDIARIEELAKTEQDTGHNLSSIMLSGAEAEKVADAKQAYKDLRDIYEMKESKSHIPKLIADLILAEESETEAAVNAVVAEKTAAVPALIDLLRSEEFYDPLFPGYGLAPTLAAECLGKIGDKRAIISLFEAIGAGDFFSESTILSALKAIGEPAKEFLLRVLHARPLTSDNDQAAVALVAFKDDPAVGVACLKMLEEIDLNTHLPLATYLILACESLTGEKERSELLALADNPKTPKSLKQDILTVSKNWHL